MSRLEKVFEILGLKAKAEKCPAIEGIIKEADELMKRNQRRRTPRDAERHDRRGTGHVEHYEITRYGTLVSWGKLWARRMPLLFSPTRSKKSMQPTKS